MTFDYLKNIDYRDAIRKRLDEVQNYESLSAPHREGEYYYYSRNSGLQNHNVQYRKKGENGTEEVFLDPNTFSAVVQRIGRECLLQKTDQYLHVDPGWRIGLEKSSCAQGIG